jgi:CRP-like cAMP-binding protein
MFFIESGSVRITSNENKVMANLGVGGCFGESALFDDRLRTNQVIATSETNLLVINREQVEREVNKEPPIVRLIVLLLIKRLEIMNTLRMRDYW